MKRIAALAVAGAVGVAGLGAVAIGGPALAADVPTIRLDDGDRHDRRADRISEALSGLVDDGTITSEQADAVAATLAERGHPALRHLRGQTLDAAANTLGMTETEVREALRDGSTLAELATDQDVEVQAVVDALVTEVTSELDDAVAAERITQERADEIAATLPERITDLVENGRGGH